MAAATVRRKPESASAGPRKDPRRRHTDGVNPWNYLKGRDPERHYVWVNKNSPSPEYGPEGYEARGYVIEFRRPDGPQVLGGKTVREGEPLEMRGHVLMSLPNAEHAEIQQFGEDGNSGQEDADRIEDIIINKRGGFDPLRGVGVRGRSGMPFVSVENEIQRPQAEIE